MLQLPTVNSGTMPARISEYLHLLRCPKCAGRLQPADGILSCHHCALTFGIDSDIPLLFWSDADVSPEDVTDRVKAFYEQTPFPDYEEFDDLASLLEKARNGIFARLLDEQIPFGSRVLECGCGTGQLSNFLAIAHRSVIGTDMCVNSLRLAEEFRNRHNLRRVYFTQMNLFRPVFSRESFDFVLCNGVLHHTSAPKEGLETLASLVKPGGYLVIGLYHRYGRLMTDLRRVLFQLFGSRLAVLDPRIRKVKLGSSRRAAWFADQYQNPHESKHTVAEVAGWLPAAGLDFVRSIPGTRFLESFDEGTDLFSPEQPVSRFERGLKERLMTLAGSDEGGFFTIIARKG